jgi:hypothetical protein
MNLALVEVEGGHLGHHHTHVAVALEDRPEGICDLAWRERSRGDLVRERLEQVEVPAVYERDVDRRFAQMLDGLKAAETAADDGNAVSVSSHGS